MCLVCPVGLLGSWGAVCTHFPRLLRSTELGCGRGGTRFSEAIRTLPRPPCAEACLRRRCRPPGEKPAKCLIALRLREPPTPSHPHTPHSRVTLIRPHATWTLAGLLFAMSEATLTVELEDETATAYLGAQLAEVRRERLERCEPLNDADRLTHTFFLPLIGGARWRHHFLARRARRRQDVAQPRLPAALFFRPDARSAVAIIPHLLHLHRL